jgi:toxin ParE1/3/4
MISKVRKVVFTPLAEADLREAWRHIAQHDPLAADRFFDAISERAANLSQFPERGAPREELGARIRMLVEGHYLVFYRVDEDAVRVVRVLHGSRDLTRLFQ